MDNDQTSEQNDSKVLSHRRRHRLAGGSRLPHPGRRHSGSQYRHSEQLEHLGGSLDGAGSAEDGYVLRGGRMIESKYLCT